MPHTSKSEPVTADQQKLLDLVKHEVDAGVARAQLMHLMSPEAFSRAPTGQLLSQVQSVLRDEVHKALQPMRPEITKMIAASVKKHLTQDLIDELVRDAIVKGVTRND